MQQQRSTQTGQGGGSSRGGGGGGGQSTLSVPPQRQQQKTIVKKVKGDSADAYSREQEILVTDFMLSSQAQKKYSRKITLSLSPFSNEGKLLDQCIHEWSPYINIEKIKDDTTSWSTYQLSFKPGISGVFIFGPFGNSTGARYKNRRGEPSTFTFTVELYTINTTNGDALNLGSFSKSSSSPMVFTI